MADSGIKSAEVLAALQHLLQAYQGGQLGMGQMHLALTHLARQDAEGVLKKPDLQHQLQATKNMIFADVVVQEVKNLVKPDLLRPGSEAKCEAFASAIYKVWHNKEFADNHEMQQALEETNQIIQQSAAFSDETKSSVDQLLMQPPKPEPKPSAKNEQHPQLDTGLSPQEQDEQKQRSSHAPDVPTPKPTGDKDVDNELLITLDIARSLAEGESSANELENTKRQSMGTNFLGNAAGAPIYGIATPLHGPLANIGSNLECTRLQSIADPDRSHGKGSVTYRDQLDEAFQNKPYNQSQFDNNVHNTYEATVKLGGPAPSPGS